MTLLAHRLRFILRSAANYREAHQGRQRLAVVQRLARIAQWELNLATQQFRWAPEAGPVFGFTGAGEAGSSEERFLARVHPDDQSRLQRALSTPAGHVVDFRMVLADGDVRQVHQEAELVLDADGEVCLVGAAQDVTEFREVESRVVDLAYFDALTGLPNRLFLREFLERALETVERDRTPLAVLSVDLDLFKRVNDTLGQAGGDALLREAAARILSSLRSGDEGPGLESRVAARLGADEFVVVLGDIAGEADALAVARRIVEQFRQSFTVGPHQIHVTVSVGVALAPEHGVLADALLERADAALHDVKARSRNGVHVFAPTIFERARRNLELESGLRRALDGARSGDGPCELSLNYQPKVGMPTRKVEGVEALLRWASPSGPVSPADFIPIAEETGLIVALGEWVLRTACRAAKRWHDAGTPLRVAVNVSARQFRAPNFVATVEDALAATGLPPGSLELEITEGLVMENSEGSAAVLSKLRALGVRIALDDFGTGYSSLSYLSWLPIDALKIDRAFVRGLGAARTDSIMTAILALSRGLGIEVVAEGVETEAQLAFLAARGPLDIQGFLFAKPMPEPQLLEWLAKHEASRPRVELVTLRETHRPRRLLEVRIVETCAAAAAAPAPPAE